MVIIPQESRPLTPAEHYPIIRINSKHDKHSIHIYILTAELKCKSATWSFRFGGMMREGVHFEVSRVLGPWPLVVPKDLLR